MGLSRLDNFLKSARGTILYVDPSSIDSTDSIENSGNSLTRPFKTIQRALAEAARFSYQRGLNNDRFNKTTIVLYPGDHLVDNRPGYIPTGSGTFSRRSGETVSDLTQWTLDTNFDLSTPDNALYKLNSIHGGLIIPRGTSIVGMDLRKTRIRPTYVPNPENDGIERSCVLRVTGASYIWQFTILDADPNGTCYKDYTNSTFVPNFSHHKLSGFEYADGVNGVNIADDFLTYSTTRTDLDMYYEKIGICYGPSSGREIQPDYNSGTVDINPVIDEYRIVGSTGASVGITSIRSGGGTLATSNTTITVDLVESIEGLSVDSPIQISGISVGGYDGQFVVSSVSSTTQFTYQVQNTPINPLPAVTGSTMSLVVDTVTSASPYIFNISLRSVYGMCGLLADGDKATGFKSMVVAQYTGIGLQKDDNAFVKYDTGTGGYKDSTTVTNLHADSRSRFKPEYENFHIKATNDSFLQLVSVFAIGYAQHFVTENGGDIALNNSNSNFGAKSLVSSGFKRAAFTQDDQGYITHIIPPKEIENDEISVEFNAIDVGVTTSVGVSTHLYLYDQKNENVPPQIFIDGYHVGAKENEELIVEVSESGTINTYSSRVVMPAGPYNATQSSSEKVFTVGKDNVGISSITANTLTLTQNHSFINGESIRIIADNGHLPDGIEPNQVYYTITKESATGIGTNQIRIAKTLSDAENGAVSGSAITLNNKGGVLSIVSRVSDKNPGDIGHPVQYDSTPSIKQWYISVASTNNAIYSKINTSGVTGLGNATTRTYVTRQPDSRSLVDTLYRVRYILPKESTGRPPIDGFILQESGDIIGDGTAEISQLYNDSGSISNTSALRNTNFIADASWTSSVATIRTELPHNLKVGDQVEIVNVTPTGYNGTYTVASLVSAKEFTYSLPLGSNPGTLTNNTSSRTSSLPYFRRKKFTKTYQVYRTQEIQSYISGIQDGVYYLTLLNHSNRPTVTPFRDEAFAQPVQNLYPQTNNDNPDSDPSASVSHALPGIIGEVVIDDPQKSITKETLESFVVGTGITNIISSSGTAHTIYTSVDHGFSGITTVSIVSGGANYGSSGSFSGDLYNAKLVGFAGSTTGSNATAKITVSSGAITSVKIIDGGSAYGIGNTLTVVGVASTTSFVAGVVRVESISNNVEDAIKVAGVTSASNAGYNTLYRISGIATGRTKEIDVVSSETISGFSTTGIGSITTSESGYIPTGKVLQVSSLTYTPSSGIATVGFTTSHGFQVDNKIRVDGANESTFNKDFIVKNINSLTELVVNVGTSATTSTSATGTLYAYRPVLTSYAGDLSQSTENISGRLNYEYAGITTVLATQYTLNDPLDTLNIPNAVSLGLNLGDYLLIDNEIFRIKTAVTSNTVSVLRAVLGSPRQTHPTGRVVRRINVRPVELRRNSIIRASGHTFEYLGYGPGNYSTSLPEKQDRALSSSEKFLAQATKTDGGIVVYTGMDSEGAFYAGNKKVNSATGQEESYDTPIPTVTGEKESNTLINITETQKLFVESSIKVEGGRNKTIVSEFDGPVIFNNKVTTNSDIETNSLFIQGNENISRNISISNIKPTSVGNYGDIEFNSTPKNNGNAGWIYTTNNEWKAFGWINDNLYGVGVSTDGVNVGLSTLINFTSSNINITRTYDSVSGISTINFGVVSASTSYANVAGIASYADVAGIATYANNAGIASYANVAGIATYADNAGITTHIKDGSQNQLVYQVAPNSTSFLPNGTTNQVLKSNGSGSAPSWVFVDDLITVTGGDSENIKIHSTDGAGGDNVTSVVLVANQETGFQNAFIDSGLSYNANTNDLTANTFIGDLQGNATSATTATTATTANSATYASTAGIATNATNAGIATNLKGGIASQIPYQTAANTTSFIPNGTSNQVLRSNGTSAPSWTSNLNLGTVTANAFIGDGSGLTGITATGTGIGIRNNGSTVGTASTINFGSGLSVSSISGGVVTIESLSSSNADNINISAIDSTDTTTSIVLVSNQTTGFQSSFIDSGLTYNANTNNLTATRFTGSLSGNATSATSASTATNCSRSVLPGSGLFGGGALTSNVTLSLGTPSSVTSTSTNSVSGATHTHELSNGSITASKLSGAQSGIAPVYGVRAWGKMTNGNTSTPLVSGGNIITNVVKEGTGRYRFTLISAMSSLNYSIVANVGIANNNSSYPYPTTGVINGGSGVDHHCCVEPISTTSFIIYTFDATGSPEGGNNKPVDSSELFFMVIG